jgi:hypothetical protein
MQSPQHGTASIRIPLRVTQPPELQPPFCPDVIRSEMLFVRETKAMISNSVMHVCCRRMNITAKMGQRYCVPRHSYIVYRLEGPDSIIYRLEDPYSNRIAGKICKHVDRKE